ncbi:PTS sugar transporter subunit IIC [Staphylococcus pettenkoferi]|nr:PTS sugar transporter subunit IIC [Staphylococcus pettenkoferi]
MEILWWQILLLSLYAGYQILDEIQFNTLNQPVFAGLIIGGSMQLVILGVGTFGGASKIDANSGTVLAVAFSVAFHRFCCKVEFIV